MSKQKIRKVLSTVALAAVLMGILCPMAFAAAAPAAPAYNSIIYKVVAGDTLTKIAKQHGTTVASIISLNNLNNPNVLRVGQELLVHAAKPPAPAAVPPAVLYVVAQGDTLYSIAKRYGTTAAKLISLNKIADPTKLQAGQKLVLN